VSASTTAFHVPVASWSVLALGMAETGILPTATFWLWARAWALGYPHPRQLRGNENGVGHDAAGGYRVTVVEVCLEDAEVVPGSVGELRRASDVTRCPNMVSGGAELAVYRDEAAVGQIHTGRLQPEVSGYWSTSGRHQQLLATHLGTVFKHDDNVAIVGLTVDSLGPGAKS